MQCWGTWATSSLYHGKRREHVMDTTAEKRYRQETEAQTKGNWVEERKAQKQNREEKQTVERGTQMEWGWKKHVKGWWREVEECLGCKRNMEKLMEIGTWKGWKTEDTNSHKKDQKGKLQHFKRCLNVHLYTGQEMYRTCVMTSLTPLLMYCASLGALAQGLGPDLANSSEIEVQKRK